MADAANAADSWGGGERSMEPWWAYSDVARRRLGELMDRLGLGPEPTPSRPIGAWATATLRAYPAPARPSAERPAVLIVPAPIKTADIWDLAPDVSVVRRCLAAGLATFLVDWDDPQAEDEGLGLDAACQAIVGCLEAVATETGRAKVFMMGHSLGGTLAAIVASQHSARLDGLVELEGPMEFGADMGTLDAALALAPRADAASPPPGNVPGSFLSAASAWADPLTFSSQPLLDWLRCCHSPAASSIHLKVRRWTLAEKPMPRRLFEEIAQQLYRENRFADGRLAIAGRPAHPHGLTAPILAVSEPHSRIIPRASIEAYRHRTGSRDVEILEYRGDVGVMLQHVGVLVGRNAHRSIWPRILTWMQQRSSTSSFRAEPPAVSP
jgi:polyhydroxyalkanoate synthase